MILIDRSSREHSKVSIPVCLSGSPQGHTALLFETTLEYPNIILIESLLKHSLELHFTMNPEERSSFCVDHTAVSRRQCRALPPVIAINLTLIYASSLPQPYVLTSRRLKPTTLRVCAAAVLSIAILGGRKLQPVPQLGLRCHNIGRASLS